MVDEFGREEIVDQNELILLIHLVTDQRHEDPPTRTLAAVSCTFNLLDYWSESAFSSGGGSRSSGGEPPPAETADDGQHNYALLRMITHIFQ